MSANERSAPATGTDPSENAAAKLQNLTAETTATPALPALLTLQQLNRLLRDEGIARADESLDGWTRSCWQTGIAYWASTGWEFTADEVRALGVPDPANPNAVGAQFMAAARAGLIRPMGFVQSRRPSRHGAWLRQWVGGDAA
ncbi:hypothetical protein SAMN03159343_0260 [Klenkia marina]|uniref:Uncharacterized protein n=1 Tax=Klenkia marina TaxID=1960309 RepID=A0A1G4X9S7_9ACTN|nr:hypothetical protein [Klenkia marina]SCX37990.1 hypothetical protein SAMN03159343_0260 [Klenkia marina]